MKSDNEFFVSFNFLMLLSIFVIVVPLLQIGCYDILLWHIPSILVCKFIKNETIIFAIDVVLMILALLFASKTYAKNIERAHEYASTVYMNSYKLAGKAYFNDYIKIVNWWCGALFYIRNRINVLYSIGVIVNIIIAYLFSVGGFNDNR